MINEVARIVETACAQPSNSFGYGIWAHHIIPVVQHGRDLAPLFNADPEIIELAALLHDYAGIKDAALAPQHHVHGPIEAERILHDLGYPAATIDAVKHCIATHRASIPSTNRSAEAICLANADAMAHIQHVPSLLHLVFVQWQMSIDEGTLWVRQKLERTWDKMHPHVQAMMQDRYAAALLTLTLDTCHSSFVTHDGLDSITPN